MGVKQTFVIKPNKFPDILCNDLLLIFTTLKHIYIVKNGLYIVSETFFPIQFGMLQ